MRGGVREEEVSRGGVREVEVLRCNEEWSKGR